MCILYATQKYSSQTIADIALEKMSNPITRRYMYIIAGVHTSIFPCHTLREIGVGVPLLVKQDLYLY